YPGRPFCGAGPRPGEGTNGEVLPERPVGPPGAVRDGPAGGRRSPDREPRFPVLGDGLTGGRCRCRPGLTGGPTFRGRARVQGRRTERTTTSWNRNGNPTLP